MIQNGRLEDKARVIDKYQRSLTLQTTNLESRGWLLDVLHCVDRIPAEDFSLSQVYAFTEELQRKHPENNFVRDKIRQQLQVLRDKGFIEFTTRGNYKRL